MNYLIDTHVVLWLLDKDSQLRPEIRSLLSDRAHALFVSAATIWEISIKQSLGKLKSPENILDLLELNTVPVLPVTAEHAHAVRSLPKLHGDPFDRMLVVQAMTEGLTIMTHDKQLSAYPVSCMMI